MANITDLGNGKYRIIISNGYNKKGKRNRISKTIIADNLKDAQKQAKIIEGEILSGGEVKRKTEEIETHTFSDIVEQWKSLIEKDDYAKKTLFRYNGILDSFLIPYFGNMDIKEITYKVVKEYMTTLDEDGCRLDGKKGGYSIQTKLHHKRLIIMLLNQAVSYNWINENPYRENESEKRKQKKKRNAVGAKQPIKFYTVEEIKQLYKVLDSIIEYKKSNDKTLLDCTSSLADKVFCHLGFETGMRLSELCGLEFNDINYANKTIEIRRTSHYTAKDGIYTQGGTKNTKPIRIVSVTEELIDLIEEYKDEYYKMWEEKLRQKTVRADRINYDIKVSHRLFTQHDGSPINPSTLTSWFPRFLNKYGLKPLTVHGMRHTHASILIFSGADILTISKRLGHSSTDITWNTYGHLMPNADRNCADKISDILK